MGPTVGFPQAAAVPLSEGRRTTPATAGKLDWKDCEGAGVRAGAQCATLHVPLDWKRKKGPRIELALARLPATDPGRRIGPLLLNPGGPGGSGVAAVAYSDALTSAPELAPLRKRFDIIGFDPRGVGASTPISCPTPLHRPDISRFPATPAAFAELVRTNRAAGTACRKATGPLINHVDTRSVVRDVNAVRNALKAPRISWLGLSYGTEIGSLYAERYPQRVRAMVLDGAVEHSLSTRRAALDEARATENALRRFADWCRGDQLCALRDSEALKVYDRLMTTAEGPGVPASQLGRDVTAEELASGVYGYLYRRAAWPLLAAELANAAGLNGPADASGLIGPSMFHDPTYPAYRSVGCHDFAPRTHGFRDMARQAKRLRAVAPHSWRYSEFWDWTSGCLGWPIASANPPAPLRVKGAPPILVVSTTHDPATPYTWAKRLSAAIDGSALLTVKGDGHTGVLHSSCARTQEAKYLITGRLPARGTMCDDA